MKKQRYTLLSFCIIILWILVLSCENEIPYRTGNVEPKLTMNSFIYVDSLKNRLYLSLTGETRAQLVGSSVVEVRMNGDLKESLDATILEGTYLRFVDITTKFQPGDIVRIDAKTNDGVHHAWIEEKVPYPVEVERVDTITVPVSPKPFYYYQSNTRVKVRFQDRPQEKNYYRILLEQRHTVRGKTFFGKDTVKNDIRVYTYWPWEDIALTNGRPATSEELDTEIFERETNYYGVFNDSWFTDSEYTLNIQANFRNIIYSSDYGFHPQYYDVDLAVRLLSITELEYYYLTTMNIIDSNILEEYISDPVKIPSNVNGGNGFVGISSEKGRVIRVVENEEIESVDYWR